MAKGERGTKGEEAYERLKAMAVRHDFRPSEKLQLDELADQLALSATPVREALVRLAAERIVRTAPNRGFYAKPLSIEEALDLHDFTLVLLRYALRQPAVNVAGALFAVEEPAAFSRADPNEAADRVAAFHRAVVALAGSPEMNRTIENFDDRLHYVRAIGLEDRGRRNAITTLMRSVAGALRARDAEAAVGAVERAFAEERGRLGALVKEGLLRAHFGRDEPPPTGEPALPPRSRKA